MKMLKRFLLEMKDTFRFHPLIRKLLAGVCRLFSHFTASPLTRLKWLCRAIRLEDRDDLYRPSIERILATPPADLEWQSLRPASDPGRIRKGVILKPRGKDGEKGVIFISFEEEWAQLLWCRDLEQFAREYYLVVAPTWSPPHSVFNYLFPRIYPGPCFTTISNPKDMKYLPAMSPQYIPVELYASNWVNPDLFKPRPRTERTIDIVMLANFGTYKRHFELFKALRNMPETISVTLVGQPHGERTADVLRAEAALYDVAHRITIRERVSNEELTEILCQARISLIFSLREGSCVAVVESLFADTPVGLFEDAAIGSRVFIDEHTGRFLSHHNLAAELIEFLDHASSYHPREWALEHQLDCYGSTKKLNEFLRNYACAHAEPWTRDIFPHHWRPDPILCREEHRQLVAPEAAYLQERYGLIVG